MMKEIVPGVLHWTATHPKIGIDVSSYYLSAERVLIDPLLPAEGLDAFAEMAPRHVVLTNRHHYRDSARFGERYGCTVWCVESGLQEFSSGEQVRPFRFGDELPGAITALEVGVICPDETALLIATGEGLLALADGVVRRDDGPLGFVPDQYMDNPEDTKRGLKAAYRGLLDREFDHLLLAHGWPWIGGGKQALREFVEG
jgi:hypothetical protein